MGMLTQIVLRKPGLTFLIPTWERLLINLSHSPRSCNGKGDTVTVSPLVVHAGGRCQRIMPVKLMYAAMFSSGIPGTTSSLVICSSSNITSVSPACPANTSRNSVTVMLIPSWAVLSWEKRWEALQERACWVAIPNPTEAKQFN